MICNRIDVWSDREYKGIKGENNAPYIDTYFLDVKDKRPCVLVLPGGGYALTSEREAEPVALQFIMAGYHAVVLHYSVAPNKHPQPLLDASLAMAYIRENSDKYNIDTEKVFVCGFSAGGHLAASLGVHWNKQYIIDELGITKGINKPNGLILCYPVIVWGDKAHRGSFNNLLGENPNEALLNEMSLEKWVGEHTPPTFIWHTFEDKGVPVDNTLMFANALNKNSIPFEMHIYPKGGHGLSLANSLTASNDSQIDPHAATWMALCLEWMHSL